MEISHDEARQLEHAVRKLYPDDEYIRITSILSADNFVRHPFQAAILVAAKVCSRDKSYQINNFMNKYQEWFRNSELGAGLEFKDYFEDMKALIRL